MPNACKIAQFMAEVAPLVQFQQKVRGQTAARFNLFEELGIARQEQLQSRFLAFLLNPKASHDQGDTFLRSFLKDFGISLLDLLPHSLDKTLVETESRVATYGRVDISVTLPSHRIILIENKVDASEGDQQICRYLCYLKGLRNLSPPPHEQHILVFLTPEGREPHTGNPTDPLLVLVSYEQLGNWMSSLLSELPERLRTVLTQYSENCHVIGSNGRYGMATGYKITNGLGAFLMDPAQLDTALEVAEEVEAIRRNAFAEFWAGVQGRLRTALTSHGYQSQWEIYADESRLGIYWKRSPSRPNLRGALQFGVARIANAPGDDYAHYGISRGKSIPPQSRDEKDQSFSGQLETEELVTNGGRFCYDWVGWRYLHDLGLPEFYIMKKEDVLRLYEDNRDPNHPLAHKLVSLLWDLFARYREALETLNTPYPY